MELRGVPGGSREVERHGSAQSFSVTGISRKVEPDDQLICCCGHSPRLLARSHCGRLQRNHSGRHRLIRGARPQCLAVASRAAVSPDPWLPAGWAAEQLLAELWHLSPHLCFRTQPPDTGRVLAGWGHPGRTMWELRIHQAGQCACWSAFPWQGSRSHHTVLQQWYEGMAGQGWALGAGKGPGWTSVEPGKGRDLQLTRL